MEYGASIGSRLGGDMTNTKKLREKFARKLAEMDNFPFDDLREKTTTLFDGATQSHYLGGLTKS